MAAVAGKDHGYHGFFLPSKELSENVLGRNSPIWIKNVIPVRSRSKLWSNRPEGRIVRAWYHSSYNTPHDLDSVNCSSRRNPLRFEGLGIVNVFVAPEYRLNLSLLLQRNRETRYFWKVHSLSGGVCTGLPHLGQFNTGDSPSLRFWEKRIFKVGRRLESQMFSSSAIAIALRC